MRLLSVLSLLLAVGCQTEGVGDTDAGAAPAADVDGMARTTVQQRLNDLEARTSRLHFELVDARKTIGALQAENAALEARVAATEDAVFETDPASGARTNKVDGFTIKQKALESSVVALDDQLTLVTDALVGTLESQFDLNGVPPLDAASKDAAKMTLKFKPEITRKVLALEQSDASQATQIAALEEFDTILDAGLAPSCNGESLRKHVGASKWGNIYAQCEGGVLRLDAVELQQSLTDAKLSGFVDDWQGETAYLKQADLKLQQNLDTAVADLGKVDGTTNQRLKDLSTEDLKLAAQITALDGKVCSLAGSTERVLRGRWDGDYGDGTQPDFWSGLEIDTPDGPLTWDQWVLDGFAVYDPAGVCTL